MAEDLLTIVRILPEKYKVEARDVEFEEAMEKLFTLDEQNPHEDFAVVRSIPDNHP